MAAPPSVVAATASQKDVRFIYYYFFHFFILFLCLLCLPLSFQQLTIFLLFGFNIFLMHYSSVSSEFHHRFLHLLLVIISRISSSLDSRLVIRRKSGSMGRAQCAQWSCKICAGWSVQIFILQSRITIALHGVDFIPRFFFSSLRSSFSFVRSHSSRLCHLPVFSFGQSENVCALLPSILF